jgi:hypothetical protein
MQHKKMCECEYAFDLGTKPKVAVNKCKLKIIVRHTTQLANWL